MKVEERFKKQTTLTILLRKKKGAKKVE